MVLVLVRSAAHPPELQLQPIRPDLGQQLQSRVAAAQQRRLLRHREGAGTALCERLGEGHRHPTGVGGHRARGRAVERHRPRLFARGVGQVWRRTGSRHVPGRVPGGLAGVPELRRHDRRGRLRGCQRRLRGAVRRLFRDGGAGGVDHPAEAAAPHGRRVLRRPRSRQHEFSVAQLLRERLHDRGHAASGLRRPAADSRTGHLAKPDWRRRRGRQPRRARRRPPGCGMRAPRRRR